MANDAKQFYELSKLNDGKKWETYSEEYKDQIKSKLSQAYIIVWLFIGLFTYQWIIFLLNLVFSVLVISPLSKKLLHTKLFTPLHWVNSVIGFSFCVFVIVNHYHLKLDINSLILSLFNL